MRLAAKRLTENQKALAAIVIVWLNVGTGL
jgi:hypothetical protein